MNFPTVQLCFALFQNLLWLFWPSSILFLFPSQERLQADEVIQELDVQAVWGQGLSINPKDEL